MSARGSIGARLGALLIAGSWVPWLLLFTLPWVGGSTARLATLAAGLLIAAQVLFWTGVAFLGRAGWQVARRAGWRRLPLELLWLVLRGRQ